MHTRSLHVLASPQLGSFQLEPSALQLPVPNSYQTNRTQSQVTPLAGATNSPQLVGASWYSPSIIGTARPNFFEPQQSQVQGGTTSPYYNAQPTSLTQYQPVFVPSSGTANYTFQPYCERDEKQQVLQLQHIGARPEFAHKSAEELRLEDYAANGVAPLTASNNEPGQVAMPSANNTLGSGGSLFGTSTVGLFGSSNQFQQPNPSLGDSFLSPSVLSNFPQQTQPNLFQSAAAGVDVNKPSIPFWGTTTAGFGAGFGAINNTGGLTSAFGSAQPNTNINSLWGQTQPQPQQQQQPSTVFGTLTNGSVFANQAPQTTAFTNFGFQQQQQQQQQQPANSSFTNTGFFNPNPAQSTFSLGNSAFPNTGFGFGFNPSSGWGNSNFFTAGPTLSFNRTIPFQYPTEAHFFWNNSPIVCWNEFLSTLPSSISTASFGGVMVHLPSIQECQMAKAREKQQASRLAKINADPFGIEMIQPLSPIVLNDTNSPTVSSVSSSVPPPASPLRQGTSSPLLTPNRSPLIAPSPQRTTDSLAVNGHQRGRSASFSRSPRLLPLPESPYVTAAPLQLTAANSSAMVSPVLRPRVPSAQSSPHKSLADRPTSNSHNSPKVSHSALFSHPPGSPQRLTSGLTNGHDREGRNDNNMIKRELEWSARLVE